MAFSFHIRSEPATRDLILRLCQQYDPGITVLRHDFTRNRNGMVVYTVDVYEPTPYGHELHDWLQRGKRYAEERKKNVHFPQELHGPIWCVLDEHGNMDRAYPTWELKLAASRGRHA